jgi:integrase
MSGQAIIWHGKKQGKEPAMPKLTQIALRSLVKKPGRHSDGQGLFFRVLDANKAYFVYRYRVGGKERETSLGAFPELSLAEARERHADMRKLVRVDRIDPIAQKRALKASAALPSAAPTFGQCADQFVETHKTGWRNSKHAWQWSRTLTTHAAAIRDLPVDEVNTEAVLRVLTPLWSAVPETAARLRGRIEAVLASAQVDGWIPEDKPNPARWRNWLERKLPKRQRLTRGHHAAMPYAELPAFWARLAEIDTVASRALMFTILTCARTSEVLHATWDDEISFADAVWRVPASRMKMQKPHDVPLSEQALAILSVQMGGKSPYVFPGGRPRQPLSTMGMAMLLRRLNVDATVHGFRSSARSWMADQGIAFELAEACLAHTTSGNVAAYQRSSLLEPRRPLMQSWSDFVTGKANDNVVALKGRARAPIRRA